MPVYPYLAERGSGCPSAPWGIGAVLVSLVAGYLACLVLYRMLRDAHRTRRAATWAALFFASGPLAALFQVGYAESLFLLWLFLSLWCVQRRRYGWLYLLIPLMGFTRPGVLAFALFLGLYGIWRWFAPAPRAAAGARDRAHRRAGAAGGRRRVLVAGDRGRRHRRRRTRTWRPSSPGAAAGSPGRAASCPSTGSSRAPRFWFGALGTRRSDRLHRAGGIRARRRGPAAVRAARQAARGGGPALGGELPRLPARRVLPAVQRVPAAGAALAAVGSGRRAAVDRVPRSACSRCACSASGGGSTTCTRSANTRTGRSPERDPPVDIARGVALS